ncbi:MAG TPA: NfeD family protein [Gaiellaceae bacterium]|nr:NfeD family protein [Gaiellaceae bacterium]
MTLVVAILLAIFYLDAPWDWIAIGLGATVEVTETAFLIRWSKRRRVLVGAETLVGRRALVAAACMPEGQVRVAGELWRAHCRAGAAVGDSVVVREIDGLTLVVEHE